MNPVRDYFRLLSKVIMHSMKSGVFMDPTAPRKRSASYL